MLDFTSALYLDFRHASQDLPEWEQLTLGKPAALEPVPGAVHVERRLARLIGCERALLTTSTLHLFWDLFRILSRRQMEIFVDADSYPIARWGVERATSLGTRVRSFRAHSVEALRSDLNRGMSLRPVIVADGYCAACGQLVPLAEYVETANEYGGLVVIDDSQALGIYGTPSGTLPYGLGGGGSLRRSQLSSSAPVLIGASLAKGFGAPLAVLAGSSDIVSEFESRSETRVHCSPPSIATVTAASQALLANRLWGDSLRMKLFHLVAHFRLGLYRIGVLSTRTIFPVQTLRLPGGIAAKLVYNQLRERGVLSVLHRVGGDREPSLSFILSTRHTCQDVDQALTHLAEAVTRRPRGDAKGVNSSWFTDRVMAGAE